MRATRPEASFSHVSWATHLGGGLVGFLLGIFILKNFRIRYWEVKCQFAAVVLFGIVLLIIAILLITSDYYEIFRAPMADHGAI